MERDDSWAAVVGMVARSKSVDQYENLMCVATRWIGKNDWPLKGYNGYIWIMNRQDVKEVAERLER